MKKSQLRKIIKEEIKKINPNIRESFDQIKFPINNLKDLNKFYIKDYTQEVGEAPEVDIIGILNGEVDEMYEVEYAQEMVRMMKNGELTDEVTATKLFTDLAGEYFG